jgi:hypothetical protein
MEDKVYTFGDMEYETVEELLREVVDEVWRFGPVERTDFEYIADDDYWDGGEDRYQGRVFKELSTGKLYKVSGYYSSWDGTQWDDVEEVEAVEKKVIVYEAISK